MKKHTLEDYVEIQDLMVGIMDLKKGDIVKITHETPSFYLGWETTWIGNMNDCIGKEYKVYDIGVYGIMMEGCGYTFPIMSVQKVDDVPVFTVGDYTAKVLHNGDVQVGCTTVDYETLEKIHFAAQRTKYNP